MPLPQAFVAQDSLMEIDIDASPARVWKALTEEWGDWWTASFAIDPGRYKAMHFENAIGGRVWEDWGDGAGLLWGRITVLDPPRSMMAEGRLPPMFGAAGITWMHWTLEENEGKTRLRFHHAEIGALTPETGPEMEKGWRFLWEGRLKAYCEGNEMAEWTA